MSGISSWGSSTAMRWARFPFQNEQQSLLRNGKVRTTGVEINVYLTRGEVEITAVDSRGKCASGHISIDLAVLGEVVAYLQQFVPPKEAEDGTAQQARDL